jgi:hypothetical protein
MLTRRLVPSSVVVLLLLELFACGTKHQDAAPVEDASTGPLDASTNGDAGDAAESGPTGPVVPNDISTRTPMAA